MDNLQRPNLGNQRRLPPLQTDVLASVMSFGLNPSHRAVSRAYNCAATTEIISIGKQIGIVSDGPTGTMADRLAVALCHRNDENPTVIHRVRSLAQHLFPKIPGISYIFPSATAIMQELAPPALCVVNDITTCWDAITSRLPEAEKARLQATIPPLNELTEANAEILLCNWIVENAVALNTIESLCIHNSLLQNIPAALSYLPNLTMLSLQNNSELKIAHIKRFLKLNSIIILDCPKLEQCRVESCLALASASLNGAEHLGHADFVNLPELEVVYRHINKHELRIETNNCPKAQIFAARD